MPLKFRLATVDDLDESLRSLYKEVTVDGEKQFVLDVDGAVDNTRFKEVQNKLNSFRKNNTRLAERLKVLLEHAGVEVSDEDGVTPEDLADLLKEKKAELEEQLRASGGKPDKEAVEAEVNRRVEQYKAKHEADLAKVQKLLGDSNGTVANLQREIDELAVGAAIAEIGGEMGLRPKAVKVIVGEALKKFKRVDGQIRALDAEGDPMVGSDGVSELTIADWMQNAASKEFDFAFEPNSGGGASGSSSGGGSRGTTGPNPWKKETWNLSEQMKFRKNDPMKAKRFMLEAGFKSND